MTEAYIMLLAYSFSYMPGTIVCVTLNIHTTIGTFHKGLTSSLMEDFKEVRKTV